MTITQDQIEEFSKSIAKLFNRILLNDIPEDASYRGFLDSETPFGLDYFGYRNSYLGLLRQVFQMPNIAKRWSEDGIQDLGHELLLELASVKNEGGKPSDFSTHARDWLAKIDVDFQEFLCYAAVSGLSVESKIDIGQVTFLPVDAELPESSLAESFLKDPNAYRDCISCSRVTAEWRRASQIHRQETEKALNVIRFIASLIWHDQPIRHVYIEGQELKRVSSTLVVSSEGSVSSVGSAEYSPHPVELNSETLKYAEFYGFDEILALIDKPSPSEIERSFLTGIQWFGQATQEFLPLVAFIKYYISIEASLKKDREHARSVLPRRLGVLLESWNRSRLDKLEDDLRGFIDERNAVFHSGSPIAASPDELQWDSRILSRQALHQLRQKLKSEKWQTKDDLIDWVNTQYQSYLV